MRLFLYVGERVFGVFLGILHVKNFNSSERDCLSDPALDVAESQPS